MTKQTFVLLEMRIFHEEVALVQLLLQGSFEFLRLYKQAIRLK